MKIPYFHIDAFANRPFAGNPAGVCVLDAWLPDATLQQIAFENNLSETAFVVARKDHYDLRWFTPAVEVDLCGHATLAAAFVLFTYLGQRGDTVHFSSRSGPLPVERPGRRLVLDGPAGIGKTSLLAAGLIPQLAEDGALAIHVREYTQSLSETVGKALSASQEQLALPLRQGAPLPELLQTVQQTAKGTLVLVLDQFEAFFHPDYPAEKRLAEFNALVEALKAIPPEYLRLVLALRDDQLLRLSDLQEALPDLFRSFMEIKPLTRAQARQAILQPNEHVSQPLFFADGLVDGLLLPELDALTRDAPDAIYPPHLQIVCRWLYDQAQARGLRMATTDLFLEEGRGAEGILVNHLDETLRTRLDRERLLRAGQARQVIEHGHRTGFGLRRFVHRKTHRPGTLDRVVLQEALGAAPARVLRK
jgi:hypothetical protein